MPNIIDIFRMLSFKDMGKTRDRHIFFAPTRAIKKDFNINKMASDLHPESIEVIVKDVIPSGKDSILVTFEKEDGTAFPYFKAGQYITVDFPVKSGIVTRPYTICSSPRDALSGILKIMIKKVQGGLVSNMAANIMEPDKKLTIHGPFGDFVHNENRDHYDVIALAGGSGITPFISMAKAIAEGDEDFNLTILYGSRDRDSICLYEDIKRIADTEDRVKLVPILSEEKRKCFESGFITAQMIDKYIPRDIDGEALEVSVYVCGPQAMYAAMEPILKEMGFTKKNVRFECAPGEIPQRNSDEVSITVKRGQETFTIFGKKDETIIMALDRAEVHSPSRCRSGNCGYCRGRVLSGQVTIPPELPSEDKLNHNGYDHRRASDKEMDIVHLCVTYPDTDIEIEIIG